MSITSKKSVSLKKKRKNIFFSKIKKKYFPYIKKHRRFIGISSFIVLLFIWFFFLLNFTLFNDKYEIVDVSFDKANINDYYNIDLYTDIRDAVLWQNFFTLNYLNKSEIINDLQSSYKILEDFSISYTWPNSILISLDFEKPNFVFYNWKSYFASYNENIFEIWTWSSLLSWTNKINIPSYTNNLDDFYWFYYKISESELLFQLSEIMDFLWKDNILNIEYLPWWTRSIIELDWIQLYFNNEKDISWQLRRYEVFKDNYEDFEKLDYIDLWSWEDLIIE